MPQFKGKLGHIIELGFVVARDLRTESAVASGSVGTSEEISTKIANAHKAKVLETAADVIQKALAHVESERRNFPPDAF